jgi:hypothetical protein
MTTAPRSIQASLPSQRMATKKPGPMSERVGLSL